MMVVSTYRRATTMMTTTTQVDRCTRFHLNNIMIISIITGVTITRIQCNPLVVRSVLIRKFTSQHTTTKSKSTTTTTTTVPEIYYYHCNHEQPPPTTTIKRQQRHPIVRFLNPWIDLANVTSDPNLLARKVDSVTKTFGVVAGLFCTLSAAALAVTPSAAPPPLIVDVDEEEEEIQNAIQLTPTTKEQKGIFQHILNTNHISGTSLLATSYGFSGKTLSDSYAACCAGSFYSSVCAVGLSAVTNAWLGCTPLHGTHYFVKYHSLVLCIIPGLLALSTGLSGVALFIGLDMSRGTPISYIGLGGTILGGILIGSTTVRGMVSTYRLLTPLVTKKKVIMR